jgi:hypothetical protein
MSWLGLFEGVRCLATLRSVLTGHMLADGDLELSTRRHPQSDDGALRLPRKLETGASWIALEGGALQTQTEECAEI